MKKHNNDLLRNSTPILKLVLVMSILDNRRQMHVGSIRLVNISHKYIIQLTSLFWIELYSSQLTEKMSI